jgi:predicted aspartyl protease
MSTRFSKTENLVILRATLFGPLRKVRLRLALDTGATRSLLPHDALVVAGYDPASIREKTSITTGSGVEYVPIIKVKTLRTLKTSRDDLEVLVHTLPPGANVDGLVGLDFLRNCVLTIDFAHGRVSLVPP